jgi:Membrane protein involved in colicin uptake
MASLSEKKDRSSFVRIQKDTILGLFERKKEGPVNLEELVKTYPEMFTKEILEPETTTESFSPDPEDVFVSSFHQQKQNRMHEKIVKKKIFIHRSPFTSSGYADSPTLRVWYYVDEWSRIQGPFTSLEMDNWFDNGFFFNELLIRFKEHNDFVPLIDLFGKSEIVQPISIMQLIQEKADEKASQNQHLSLEISNKPIQPEKVENSVAEIVQEKESVKPLAHTLTADLMNMVSTNPSTCDSSKSLSERLTTPEKVSLQNGFFQENIESTNQTIEKEEQQPSLEINKELIAKKKERNKKKKLKEKEPKLEKNDDKASTEVTEKLELQSSKPKKKERKNRKNDFENQKHEEHKEKPVLENGNPKAKPTVKKETPPKRNEIPKKNHLQAVIYVPKVKPEEPKTQVNETEDVKKKKRRRKKKNAGKKDLAPEDPLKDQPEPASSELSSRNKPAAKKEKKEKRSSKQLSQGYEGQSIDPKDLFLKEESFQFPRNKEQMGFIHDYNLHGHFGGDMNTQRQSLPEENIIWSDSNHIKNNSSSNAETGIFTLFGAKTSEKALFLAYEEFQKYKKFSSDSEDDQYEEQDDNLGSEININTNLKFLDDFSSL